MRQVLTKTFAALAADERAQLQDLLNKVLREDGPDTAPHSSRKAPQPLARLVKTLAGIGPECPVVRAGGHHYNKASAAGRLSRATYDVSHGRRSELDNQR